jgi:hypothetical protein
MTAAGRAGAGAESLDTLHAGIRALRGDIGASATYTTLLSRANSLIGCVSPV